MSMANSHFGSFPFDSLDEEPAMLSIKTIT